jgi:hypothetical protein
MQHQKVKIVDRIYSFKSFRMGAGNVQNKILYIRALLRASFKYALILLILSLNSVKILYSSSFLPESMVFLVSVSGFYIILLYSCLLLYPFPEECQNVINA